MIIPPPTSPSTEKVWGVTTPLLVTPLFEMHRLAIKPLHRCSLHEHQFKHNAFYVIAGILCIDSEIDGIWQVACLNANDVFTIAPGVRHQFRTGSLGCMALEMYFTEPLSEDIIRANIGGPV